MVEEIDAALAQLDWFERRSRKWDRVNRLFSHLDLALTPP